MRKPIGLFVAAFATVAGGGLAVAIEDDGTNDGTTDVTQNLFAEDDTTTTTASTDDTTTTTTTDTTDTTDTTATTDPANETIDVEADNHGAVVSQAAQVDCWAEDVETNHGQCVSAIARDHDGDGTPDHGPGSEESDDADEADETDADDTDDSSVSAQGRGNGNGRGNGHR